MLIRSLIKSDYETIGPYEGTHTVKSVIAQHGAVVVMEQGTYLGVLTADDMLTRPHNLIIDCIATRPGLSPTHSILDTMGLMKQSRVRVLPVYDRESFVGLIHYDDIIEYLSTVIDEQKNIVQTIAHDLKSPISSILGLSSLLRNNLVKQENIELLNYADQACGYATEIINDLLLIPQLEGDQDEKREFEQAEINSIVKECIEHVRVLAASKGIELFEDISNENFYSGIHKSKFKRAVNNILTNAIKFTPANGYIGLSTSQSEHELLIKIKDSGIGIPLSTQPYVFNKLTKAKRTGTDGEKSIGLGLYITKQIIEFHDGQLWFESDEKSGTTFFIKLGKGN